MPASESIRLTDLSTADGTVATALLAECCASSDWLAHLLDGRPYRSLAELLARSEAAIAALGQQPLLAVIESHPRLGERPIGDSTSAAWSRAEQAAAIEAGQRAELALRQANLAYEERFGHVFLSCASGKGAAELLGEIHHRLQLEPAAELEVARVELVKIVRIRLERVFQ